MKKIILTGAVFLLLGVLGVSCFFIFRDSDEKKIRRTLHELCSITSKNSGENPALGALKANRADKVFAPKCRLNFKVRLWDGDVTPTEIGARLVRVHALFQWCKITFSDLQTEIRGDEAHVIFTGNFTGVSKQDGRNKIDEIRDIEGKLARDPQGNWKIYSLDVRNILDK